MCWSDGKYNVKLILHISVLSINITTFELCERVQGGLYVHVETYIHVADTRAYNEVFG